MSTSAPDAAEEPAAPTIDRLDRQLLHALQLDGRAPFRRLAQVLGVSEQTVARRYRRLRDAGVVRVLALPDPLRSGQNWLLRVGVEPPAARPLAAALAALPDVAWIGLMAGGAEIGCGVRARDAQQRDSLLLRRLPRTARVTSVTACAVLHRFSAHGRAPWDGFDDPLDRAQRDALVSARRSLSGGEASLTPEDEPLLACLAQDGRMSYAELAARTGMPESQVARRVDALLGSGSIYLDVDLATRLLGFEISSMIYATVTPSQLHAVGKQLAAHSQTAFVAAVTGPTNLIASVATRDFGELYEYLTSTIGAIPAIEAVETVPVLERVKQAGTVMRGALLAMPE